MNTERNKRKGRKNLGKRGVDRNKQRSLHVFKESVEPYFFPRKTECLCVQRSVLYGESSRKFSWPGWESEEGEPGKTTELR